MRRPRVVVYVTREHPLTGADQLLVFEHPELPGLHCPAGGIEAGETPEQAAAREVQEETGLEGIAIVLAKAGGLDKWEHSVSGTGMDAGLVFLLPLGAARRVPTPLGEG